MSVSASVTFARYRVRIRVCVRSRFRCSRPCLSASVTFARDRVRIRVCVRVRFRFHVRVRVIV